MDKIRKLADGTLEFLQCIWERIREIPGRFLEGILWGPAFLTFLAALLLGVNETPINTLLEKTSQGEPFAWIILAPALQLIGGLTLLFIPAEVDDNDRKWAECVAKKFYPRAEDEPYQNWEVRYGPPQRMLLRQLGDGKKRFEDWIGFGVLSAGFGVDLLSIGWNGVAPLPWGITALAITGAILAVIKWIVWPCYRERLDAVSFEYVRVHFDRDEAIQVPARATVERCLKEADTP